MTPVTLSLFAGALLGGIGVCLGALGAHALQERISDAALASFKTGVLYQMLHALALLALAALAANKVSMHLRPTIILWLLGTILFSGSIYLLSLRSQLGIDHWRWLGPITPLGGVLLIAGWLTLAVQALISKP